MGFTNLIRIAYASLSVNKTSDENLFIVWLIEYQGVPYYLLMFIPTFAGSYALLATTGSNYTTFNIYGYNGSCNLACNGNCPPATINGYIVTVQNGTPTVQIPAIMPVGMVNSSAQVLICSKITYDFGNIAANKINTFESFWFSSSYSANVALSPSGGTFFVFFITLTITYQVS